MSRVIPFIHNYCDRWCERCAFADRCSVGLAEQSRSGKDISSEEFWKELGDNMARAAEMLKEAMEKHGIQMEPVNEEDMIETEIKHLLTESHPLIKHASAYAKEVAKVLKSHEELEQEERYADYIEVISWYQYFIQMKLSRAISGLSDQDEEEEDGFQQDYNGSAKVALMAINRSTEAWTTIYRLSELKIILYVLAALDKLKLLTQNTFPDCHHFKRPGFDD